jgi:hypothetical protein
MLKGTIHTAVFGDNVVDRIDPINIERGRAARLNANASGIIIKDVSDNVDIVHVVGASIASFYQHASPLIVVDIVVLDIHIIGTNLDCDSRLGLVVPNMIPPNNDSIDMSFYVNAVLSSSRIIIVAVNIIVFD